MKPSLSENTEDPKEALNKHQFSAPHISKSSFGTDFHRNPVRNSEFSSKSPDFPVISHLSGGLCPRGQ